VAEKNWQVDAAPARDVLGPKVSRHWEDGFIREEWPDGYIVSLWSEYGRLYYHPRTFDTAKDADAFVDKLKAHLKAGRKPNLDNWHFIRVMYGSQAYLDEEPQIVWQERHDALEFEAFGNHIPIGGACYE